MNYHIPVLLNEVIEGLKIRPGGRYIDATVGDGGHTEAILKKGGMVLGIDRDEGAIKRASKRLKKEIEEGRLVLMRSNFDKLKDLVKSFAPVSSLAKFAPSPSPARTSHVVLGVASDGSPVRRGGSSLSRKFANFANLSGAKPEGNCFDGILFDLGMSSGQIEGSGRGFSFLRDEPLDMRMDKEPINRLTDKPINRYTEEYSNVTAADLVNGLGKKELVSLFLRLGQVERAGAIAEAIVRRRREGAIKTTAELADVIEKVLPRRGKLHPATKVFMALRMAVNDELGSLERALPQAVDALIPGGRLAVISFHEGEDRIVKRFFRSGSNQVGVLSRSTPLRRPPPRIVFSLGVRALERGPFASHPSCFFEVNKKPIVAGVEEMRTNPRARSAKLRIGYRNLREIKGE